MKDFAAIDFETANGKPSSVCSVGVVIVRDSVIVNHYHSLIHPVPNIYNINNVKIHGITARDTDGAPRFPDVWDEIEPLIEGLPLVAHNSHFDEGCLRCVFEAYGIEYPGYHFFCTCRASRKRFGRELPNHQLQTVAARCGYNLKSHHEALADAEACAWIAMEIL